MPDRSEQLAWAGVTRVGTEQIPNRLEPDRHVVAVIAVTQDRVQAGQVVSVTVDSGGTPLEIGAQICSSDGRQDGASVARQGLGSTGRGLLGP
jgi:hypothetical protein